MIEEKDVNSLPPASVVPQPKKPYTAPRVVVHGTVAEITAKSGNFPDTVGSFPGQTN